jgi:N-acetyl-anhydromuramyl-L-alanine amidase AmpD
MAPSNVSSLTRPSYQPGRPGAVRMIVMHATAGSYPGDYSWLKHGGGVVNGKDTPVSVQYYIDKEGRVTQFVDDGDTAWHCGKSTWTVDGKTIPYDVGCNPVAVGIELSNSNTGHEPYPNAQYQSALILVHALVLRHNIPRSQLVRHLDIAPGRKTDPAGFPWSAFVAEVYSPVDSPEATKLPLGQYRVRSGIDYAQVRQDRATSALEANVNGVSARLQPGTWVYVNDITAGWAHLSSGLGFVALSLLERVPESGLTFLHPPRISKATFAGVLASAQSPATAEADAMYDGCTATGVDPALLLAFLRHESNYGKVGICKVYDTKNPGNVRRPFNPTRATIISTSGGPFAKYATWTLGAIDWAERLKVWYADPTNADPTFPAPLDTVEAATPVYAPVGDGNDPQAYARAVRASVEGWQAMEAGR